MSKPRLMRQRFPISFALAALFAFNAAMPVFADGTAALDLPPMRSTAPGIASLPAGLLPTDAVPIGPSEARLRAAFPDRKLQRMDPEDFQALVSAHAGEGRLLSGIELAAVMDRHPTTTTGTPCDTLASLARSRCLDSLARNREARPVEATPDSQAVFGNPPAVGQDQNQSDASAVDKEEAKGWFYNLFVDLHNGGSRSGGLDAHDWAVLFFVVIGFVVVGAFIIYGVETLAEIALNQDHYPLFQEAGLRLSYSGEAWQDGVGTDLYRDAYLAGLRYAIGFDRPGADVGLALEGGYIDIHLRPAEGPGNAFDFRGAYFVAGPILRFGSFDPACFSLEFLNGTSNHPSIGWISKARMSLQFRMGRHQAIGADLGAVFYDLAFLDGLAWRHGNLNRDLSLIGGLDFGWEF
ncbi:MAG: hypothetical protein JF616_14570 [Fibrobacteres bacterium]|nr:hypothetical protein [Fibrobacterota bacterium]